MTRHHKSKSPPYFLYLIILILLIYSCYITNAYSNSMDKLKYKQEIYYISAGETMWGMAQQYKNSDDTIREWISKVKKLNNMTNSKIFAGEEIIILVDNTQGGW